MKIKRINISKHGPISDFHYDCDNINLFFGNNESGKTALVDALIQLLFSSRRKIFRDSDRFIKNETSNIVIDFNGREYVFPSHKVKLEELLGLPDIELSRLFIVRAGDLRLEKSQRWWSAIKQLLTNLSTDLAKVKDYIYNNVGLTKTGEWSSAKSQGNKKLQIDTMHQRLKKLIEARNRLKEIFDKEERLNSKKEEVKIAEDRLEKLRSIQQYLKYKEAKELFDEYRSIIHQLQYFDRYKLSDLEEWKRLKDELYRLRIEKDNCQERLREKKLEHQRIQGKKLKEVKEKIEECEKIESLFEQENLNNIFYNFVINKFLLRQNNKFFVYTFLFLCFFLFLILRELSGNNFYLVVAIVNIVILILVYLVQEKVERGLKRITTKVEQLSSDVMNLGDVTKDIAKIENKIVELKSTERIYKESLNEINVDKEKLDRGLREFSKLVEEKLSRIQGLREKTGKSEYKDLELEINKKNELKDRKNRIEGRLKDILAESDRGKWPTLIDNLRVSPPKDEIDYSIEEERKLREKIERLKKEEEDLDKEVELFFNKLEAGLGIDDIGEIFLEISKLSRDMENFNIEREAALLSGKIIDNFSNKFDLQLKEILKAGSKTVTYYFRRFTKDRYVSVEFKEKEFIAEDKYGNCYKFSDLSTGTQDQLMFSVRIAFLLKGFKHPGFLILDDAFLSSDYSRRENLVEVMNELIKMGWQIFYLTIDNHIRDLFVDICGAEVVML